MLLISTLSFTVLKLHHLYQEKNASSNSLITIHPVVLMSNSVFKNNSADDAGSVLLGGKNR